METALCDIDGCSHVAVGCVRVIDPTSKWLGYHTDVCRKHLRWSYMKQYLNTLPVPKVEEVPHG